MYVSKKLFNFTFLFNACNIAHYTHYIHYTNGVKNEYFTINYGI